MSSKSLSLAGLKIFNIQEQISFYIKFVFNLLLWSYELINLCNYKLYKSCLYKTWLRSSSEMLPKSRPNDKQLGRCVEFSLTKLAKPYEHHRKAFFCFDVFTKNLLDTHGR